MTSIWSFTFIWSNSNGSAAHIISETIEAAEKFGYQALNPLTRSVAILSLTTNETQHFDDVRLALSYLAYSGGSVQLWKGDIDIGLYFEQTNRQKLQLISGDIPAEPQRSPSLYEVSLTVDGTFFRYDRDPHESVLVANDLIGIFESICISSQVEFAYSFDEEYLELLLETSSYEPPDQGDVEKHLYWLQYLADSYFGHIEQGVFRTLGGIIRRFPHGTMIQFADYPWNVNIDQLLVLNKSFNNSRRYH